MSSYWLSFRLADSGDYARTYAHRAKALDDEIMAACGGKQGSYWAETTSFYVFETSESIDVLVARVKRAVAVAADLVVIRHLDRQAGRVIGNCIDQDIFVLAPYMRKV